MQIATMRPYRDKARSLVSHNFLWRGRNFFFGEGGENKYREAAYVTYAYPKIVAVKMVLVT